MADRFSEWIWEDEARAERLTREYNDRFNSYVLRSYDGVKPALPGLADGWKPREHQNSAVTRILNEPAVLLAHEVGAGKTAEMVMGAMELRRTGLAKKPAIVVPNHMLEQFTREFLECYPNANILAAGTKDLEKDKRRRFVARAATGDWDCIILTQKAFEKIDMTADAQRAYMEEELQQLRDQMERAKEHGEDSRAFKQLEKQLMRAEERLKAKLDAKRDEGNIYWEHTGIDYLMVDEAHMYKNLRTPSRIEGAGIAGSTRASDLHMKLHYLRSKSESGRAVTLATGTPIANSVTEAYTMMRYLRPDLLEEAGIEDFDTWAATFGNVVTDVEMNPDGNGFRMKARFSKFQNVPELLRMYRISADVKTAADLNLPTPTVRRDANGKRGETIVTPADDAQLEYIQELGVRAEAVRAKRPWEWVNDPVRGIKGMPRAQYEELYGEVPDPPEDPADRGGGPEDRCRRRPDRRHLERDQGPRLPHVQGRSDAAPDAGRHADRVHGPGHAEGQAVQEEGRRGGRG
ncbi:DEAD/DEAH box helicase family protein [Nonomuraea candida]|uniref:DEAD/DEAH box helicase family protein n=1 Tax=Nonomuraea candida TaxID=359159 RepID=UPI000AF03210|nr:DEAD/DEAH box helicase family protein [Nonomuraea candida]